MDEGDVAEVEDCVDLSGETIDGVLELLAFVDHFDVLYQHFKL